MIGTKNRACGRKQQHPTKAAAEQHRGHLIRSGAFPAALRVYPCRHGARYHVGHVGIAGRRRRA